MRMTKREAKPKARARKTKDFLDVLIKERTVVNPDFPELLAKAEKTRKSATTHDVAEKMEKISRISFDGWSVWVGLNLSKLWYVHMDTAKTNHRITATGKTMAEAVNNLYARLFTPAGRKRPNPWK